MDITTLNNTTTGNTTHIIPHPTINYFGYTPNEGLEIAVIVIFAILTTSILYQNIWKKTWVMMPLPFGGFIEVIAYVSSTYTTENMVLGGYIVYLVCSLVAPTVLAAADYALAGHIMVRGEARVACFTPTVTKVVFLIFDIIAFMTQGVGGVIVGDAKTLDDIRKGANIVLIGQAISLVVFVTFLAFATVLHRRIIRNVHNSGFSEEERKWTRIFWVIYFNMLVLIIRAFYRIAQFHAKLATPPDSTLSGEAYVYALDTFLMIVLMISWAVFHPWRFGMHAWREGNSIPMTVADTKKVNIKGVQN